MGFGWLFVGYFTATFMTWNTFGALIRMLGYGLILMAAKKLRQYHRAFDIVGLGGIIMLLIASVFAFADITKYLYNNLILESALISDGVLTVFSYIEQGAAFFFNTALLWAIRKIAKETEVIKISENAVRNFFFLCVYYIVYLVSFLPVATVQACAKELSVIGWMLYFAWLILNLMLIFSCYARICDENDTEMEARPSRFAFVNRFREENERRAKKAYEEKLAYRQSKQMKKTRKQKTGKGENNEGDQR